MGMKSSIATLALASLSIISLAGCGGAASNSNTGVSPSNTSATSTSSPTTQTQKASSQKQSSSRAKVVQIAIKLKKGSDGKQHPAFEPANLTLKKGVPVKFVIENYDTEMHTMTATSLNLNVTIDAASTAGKAVETDATFTPSQTGSFTWMCMNPCDTKNGEWAMAQKGFMQGTITVK